MVGPAASSGLGGGNGTASPPRAPAIDKGTAKAIQAKTSQTLVTVIEGDIAPQQAWLRAALAVPAIETR
jgi:hypothetical protein